MLAFSNDYYGIIFRATQSVELFCAYEYGDEYKRNCLIFDDIPDEIRKAYNPFDSCASAQILIKKEQKEVIR